MRRVLCIRTSIIIISLMSVLSLISYHNSVASIRSTSYFEHNISRNNVLGQVERNFTELWPYLNSLVGNDTLYPESLDVPFVLEHLRTARITNASIFQFGSSLKWMLHLEGGAKAIFKPELVLKTSEVRKCNVGCEHPEYEIAGFAINRMLNLRNMPYVTGRVISWTKDLLPVADKSLLGMFTVGEDDVCLSKYCWRVNTRTKRCFPKEQITGALIYFLPFKIISYRKHLPWSEKKRPYPVPVVSDDVCKHLREHEYVEDSVFADATDFAVVDFLVSHIDTQHFFIAGKNRTHGMNVVLDFGRAFCPASQYVISNLLPILQCCKIRKRLYEALVKYKDNFAEKFISLTKDDPLFPTLSDKILATFQPRIQQVLALVDLCIEATHSSLVLMDF